MANNNEIMNGLLGKVFNVMTAPDSINPQASAQSETFISYTQPGLLISPDDLNFGNLSTGEQVERQAQFSYIVNYIPNPSGFWSNKGSLVWDVYNASITGYDLKATELTPKETEMKEKAEKYLLTTRTTKNPFTDEEITETVPSSAVQAYESYGALYQALLMTYNNMAIEANSPDATPQTIQEFNRNGPLARQAVVQAYQAWSGEGNKGFVEEARAILGRLGASSNEARYAELRTRLNINMRTSPLFDSYYNTLYFPINFLQNKKYIWTKFTYSEKDINEYKEKSSSSWGGGTSVNYGLWSFSANASHSQGNESMNFSSNGFSLSVELTQLPIIRPWFDGSIYNSTAWKWKREGEAPISDGGNPPKGMMPIIPTSIILAKNLSIKMDTKSEQAKSSFSKLETSASGGWGPFRVKGNYSSSKESSSYNCNITSTGIESPELQIIGFICNKLPKSPNPSW